MSKLEIDLDAWREQAMNDDLDEMTSNDIEEAAGYVGVMMEDEERLQYSKIEIMRKHPQLVGACAQAHVINRLEHTYRTLNIEKLRLLESIDNSLERIASAAESEKGKRNE